MFLNFSNSALYDNDVCLIKSMDSLVKFGIRFLRIYLSFKINLKRQQTYKTKM